MATMTSVHHPLFARVYARFADVADRKGAVEHRRELLSGLTGRVIEVGAGTGSNFPLYPETVTEVLAIEPEGTLRALAERAAADAPVRVTVLDAISEALPTGAASFDAGVASLVLCSVAEPDLALTELFRVIRPGGELRFYEHVLSTEPRLAAIQHSIDTIWPYFAGGCHASRDTVAHIEHAGFQVTSLRRFSFRPSVIAYPVSPHVIGVACRPAQARTDEATFEELSREECLELLAMQQVGRLAISTGMHPIIFPVNYVLDGEAIVFRTASGTKLEGSAGLPVAFEVDALDIEHRSGWSVHLWGKASEIGPADSAAQRARVYALPLAPWSPGEKEHWVRIVPAGVSGRRIRR